MGSRGESEKNERKQNHCGATASPRQENEIKDGIGELIQQERVVIFSKSTCPYCDDAKKVCDCVTLKKIVHMVDIFNRK